MSNTQVRAGISILGEDFFTLPMTVPYSGHEGLGGRVRGPYRRARSMKLSEWVREVLLTAARGDEAGSAAHLCERWSGIAQVLRCALFSSKFSFISKMKTVRTYAFSLEERGCKGCQVFWKRP